MKLSLIALLVNLSHLTVCFPDKEFVTEDDVVALLNKMSTDTFISGFNNSYQRWIIEQQLTNCPYVPLCGYNFDLWTSPFFESCCKRCDCDFPRCMTKNNCCPDAIFRNIYMKNDTAITRQDLKLITGEDTQKKCIHLFLPIDASKQAGQVSAYAYATCPLGTKEELEQNCTRIYTADSDIDKVSEIVPVLSKGQTNLYRNKYCAYCHNISDFEIQPLKSLVSCKLVTHIKTEKDLITETLSRKLCGITFVPEGRLDRCTVAISKCNVTGRWRVYDPSVERACELYTSTVQANNMTFQNIFCNECNGLDKPKLQCERTLKRPEENDFSFSGLLKLNRGGSAEGTSRKDITCSEDQLYDKILGKCKDIFCSVISTLSRGKCVDLYEKVKETAYVVFIRIKPVQQMSVLESHEVSGKILDYIGTNVGGELCGVQVLLQSSFVYDENNIHDINDSSLLYYDIRVQFYVDRYHDPNHVVESIFNRHNFTISSHNVSFEMRVRDSDPKPFDIVAVLSGIVDPSELNPSVLGSFGSLPLSVLIRDYAAPGENKLALVPYPIRVIHSETCSKSKSKTPLNVLWLKSCPKVSISRSDFSWFKHADSLIILQSHFELTSEEFYYADDDHIMVCLETYKDFMLKMPPLDKFSFSIETIISIAFSSLSIISLILTFMAFSFFSQLRQTIPGKNSMSLVFCLLCAQCLYMIKSLNRLDTDSIECVLMGMSVHFFWLVALFWMNNCTFHMFRVLSKTKMISQNSGIKRFVMYHVYALGMAAIFISINTIVSYFLSGHMGYGGSVCYISSQDMINYTFVIPVTFVIVSNISMFLVVVFKISRMSAVRKNVQNERNDLLVFAKLSTITGATWAFGLLYTWTNVTVFSYLFIIFNAFQGVFIMLAFIVNRRVYDLLMSKSSIRTSSRQAVTTSTNVTGKT